MAINFKSNWTRLGFLLSTTPLWKLAYHALDAVGNFQTVKEIVPYVFGIAGSWRGAIVLMLLGFALLFWQMRRQSHLPTTKKPIETDHDRCYRDIRNLTSQVVRLQEQDATQGIQLAAYKGDAERFKGELEKEKTWSKALTTQLEAAQTEIALLKKPKLTFEVDEAASQVHYIGGGGFNGGEQYRLIEANVKLRCEKSGADFIGVRDFRASLCVLGVSDEEVLVSSLPFKRIYDYPNMELVKMDDGWIIREPISNYRWVGFHFKIPIQIEGALSRDHFFRVTMDAVDQEPQDIEFYVVSWNDARKSNSDIKLKR